MKSILDKALDEMQNTFSSNEFSEVARKLGITERQIRRGMVTTYLHENAQRHPDSKRMWDKRVNGNIDLFNAPTDMEIKKAIALLKSNGYKIMQPVNEFVEI
jgi:hypothetical protein